MLTLFYPPFRAADEVEMLELATKGIRAYAEDLAGHPAEIIRSAWRTVRREHKTERWPTINAILSAIGDAPGRGRGDPRARRPATEAEQEFQRKAYGEVRLTNVTEADVAHHRHEADRRARGEKGGYNPYGGRRAA
jgi:hypothetical protein